MSEAGESNVESRCAPSESRVATRRRRILSRDSRRRRRGGGGGAEREKREREIHLHNLFWRLKTERKKEKEKEKAKEKERTKIQCMNKMAHMKLIKKEKIVMIHNQKREKKKYPRYYEYRQRCACGPGA